MKSYQVAEIVKALAPARLRDDEAKPLPVAQTAWLDTHNSTDFCLRETFWQIALLPIDTRARTPLRSNSLSFAKTIIPPVSNPPREILAHGSLLPCVTWYRSEEHTSELQSRP